MAQKGLVSFHEIGPVTVASIQVTSLVSGLLWESVTEELLERIRKAGGVNLLLDFHRVQHMSFEFFREVLRVNEVISASGGAMRLCGLRRAIREILETSGLDRQLRVEGSVRHALRRYVRFLEQKGADPAQCCTGLIRHGSG